MDKGLEIELAAVRPRVLALVRKFFRASGLGSDPEDVVQDVLLRLWEARRKGADIRNVEAWVITTTKNCCISLWRKSRKGVVLPLREDLPARDSASGTVEQSEAKAALSQAWEKIPLTTRHLLKLRARGLSLDELAAVTGRPKGSVKSSISAARKTLMKTLE